MRYLLVLLSLALVFAPNPYRPNLSRKISMKFPSFSNITEFLSGFAYATQAYDFVGAIGPCVQKYMETKADFSQIPDLFKEHQGSLALELIEEDVLTVVLTCSPLIDIIKNHTIEFLQIVRDPNFLTLAKERISHNFFEILKNLTFGVESWKNGNYSASGWGFGNIAQIILSGPNQSSTVNFLGLENLSNGSCPFLEFVRGYLESLKVLDSVPDGLQCLDDLDGAKETLLQVLDLFEQGKSLEAISLLMQTFTNDLASCEKGLSDGKALFGKFLKNVGQSGFIETVVGRITNNLLTLIDDFENGVNDVKNLDFYDAGKEFGKIPHLVLSGADS